MIVGFSHHGTGGGSGPVGYLTQATNPDGSERTPQPETVRGDAEIVRRLIDAVPFERKYTSGVLSFAPGEVITPAMEETIMDGFERVAFAGLSPERYSILWVRHRHAGHHELHFVTPRMELVSGKSLNIHPPGRVSKALFDTFRSQVNAEYGLADPDDPSRARDVSLPHHVAKLQAAAKRQGKAFKEDIRETITTFIRREMALGRIRDREGVVTYLKGQGFNLTRSGADYVTILTDTGERVRLKGGIYSRMGFHAQEAAVPDVRYGVPDMQRAAALGAQLEPMVARRATFHRRRYGEVEDERTPEVQPQPPEHGTELLSAYVERHLGADALRPERQRQRSRATRQEPPRGRGRGSDDRPGTAVARRLAAFGETLRRAGQRHDAALANLDRASGRLGRAGGALSANVAAIDPWEWLKWRFYGQDREAERWHRGQGMER